MVHSRIQTSRPYVHYEMPSSINQTRKSPHNDNMKNTIITLCLLFIGLSGLHAQQHKFMFRVNQTEYELSEQQLNDFFGAMFQQFLNDGTCKSKDFQLWQQSFEGWKYMAGRATYSFSTYGNMIGQINYNGSSDLASSGLDKNGNSAKGNPNKESNLAVRMAILNRHMGKYICNTSAGLHIQ